MNRDTSLPSIGRRLQEYLSFKRIGVNQFGRLTHTSGAQISNVIRGKNYGITKLVAILNACPELNPSWLLQGEGKMVLEPQEIGNTPDASGFQAPDGHAPAQTADWHQENTRLRAEIEKLQLQITSLEGITTYQSMTIDAYKNSAEVLAATNRDLKEVIQFYKDARGGEDKNRRIA